MNLSSMKRMLSTSLLAQEKERLGLPCVWVLSLCVRGVSVCEEVSVRGSVCEGVSVCVCVCVRGRG